MPTPFGDSANPLELQIIAVFVKEGREHARLAFHFTAPPGAAFSALECSTMTGCALSTQASVHTRRGFESIEVPSADVAGTRSVLRHNAA